MHKLQNLNFACVPVLIVGIPPWGQPEEEEEEEEEEEGLFKADAVNRREGGCRNAFKMYIV